jgi:tRNA nucleotidyltransferase (CCA-adding enzyme)
MTKLFLENWPFDRLFKTFRQAGESLYLVGGAVRDLLLGKKPEDWDLTTSAVPEQTAYLLSQAFPDRKPILKGRRFGTIGIDLSDQNKIISLEITTFRKEEGYGDRRHPDSVAFQGSVLDDVRRRDFTVNGLLMDEKGVIFDAVGGLLDLKRRRVRCIGEPVRRFEEDRLRKWRGVRFAAQIGGEMDVKTRKAICGCPDTAGVSVERLQDELKKMLLCGHAACALQELAAVGLWDDLLRRLSTPEIRMPGPAVCKKIEHLPADLEMRLAWLLQDAPAEGRRSFLKGLRFSKKEIQRVDALMIFNQIDCGDIIIFKTMLREAGLSVFEQALTLQELKTPEHRQNRRCLARILKNKEPVFYQDLAVRAEDLMALGFSGRAISTALARLCRLVYAHPEANTKNQLLQAAKQIKNEENI